MSNQNSDNSDSTTCSTKSNTSTSSGVLLPNEPELIRLIHQDKISEAIQLLNEDKADPNSQSTQKFSALHMAALSDLTDLITVLLDKGARVDSLDTANQTPLHYAASWGNFDALKTLIDHGHASVSVQCDDQMYYLNRSIPIWLTGGQTPLHVAAEKGYVDCVRYLVHSLKDQSSQEQYACMKDYNDRTAFDLAVNAKRYEIAKILQDYEPSLKKDESKKDAENTMDISEVYVIRKPLDMIQDREQVKSRMEARRQAILARYKEIVKNSYVPLHADVYDGSKLMSVMLDESLRNVLQSNDYDSKKEFLTEVTSGIYTFPMFTPEFCKKLIEELDNIESSGLDLSRPNSMNNYGMILNHLGFDSLMTEIMKKIMIPLGSVGFTPAVKFGSDSLDSHHSFIVKYKIGEDVDLSRHIDDAEITLNVCIGKKGFTGGDLIFYGVQGSANNDGQEQLKLKHVPGVAVLHLGRHWHAADKITAGERWNLIIWGRSSERRSKTTCG